MKNIKKIFILSTLLIIASLAHAQSFAGVEEVTPKKFLTGQKRYKKVAKETYKLEKDLKEVLEAPQPSVEVVPAPVEVVQPAGTQPAEAEAQQTPVEPEKEQAKVMVSAVATTSVIALRVRDAYGRVLKPMSFPCIGGFAALGYRFNNSFALIGDFSADRIALGNFNTYIVLMAARFATRFYITKGFSIDLLGGLRQNYVAYTTSSTTINIGSFTHGLAGLGLNYLFIERENFLMSGRTDVETYFPRNSATWKSNTGLGLSILTELRFGLPIADRSSFYMKLGGGYINVEPTIASQYGIVGFMGVGFTIEN